MAGTPRASALRHARRAVSMHSRAFVVRVPHAACPAMGVQVVVMQDTLLVWCGAVPSDIDDEARDGAYAGALSRDWSVAMHVPRSTTMATPLYRAPHHDDVSRRMSERLGTLGGVAHPSDEARSAPVVPIAGSAGCAGAERPSLAGARGGARPAGAGAGPARGARAGEGRFVIDHVRRRIGGGGRRSARPPDNER